MVCIQCTRQMPAFFGAFNKLSNRCAFAMLKHPPTRSSIAIPGHLMRCLRTMYGAENVFGVFFGQRMFGSLPNESKWVRSEM